MQTARRRSITVALVVGALLVGGTGTAFGLYLTGGPVTASHTVPTAAVTGFFATAVPSAAVGSVSPGTDASGTGATTANFTVTLTNTSTGPETITTITPVLSGTPPTGCQNSWYSVSSNKTVSLPINNAYFPANGTIADVETVSMPPSATNEDACAGYSPTITVTYNGTNP